MRRSPLRADQVMELRRGEAAFSGWMTIRGNRKNRVRGDAWRTLEEPEIDAEVARLDVFHDAGRIDIDQLNAHGRQADPEVANGAGKDVGGMERPAPRRAYRRGRGRRLRSVTSPCRAARDSAA